MENARFINKFNATHSNMNEILQDLRYEKEIEELCKEYSLNISVLKPLFIFSMKGFNNKEIAEKMGVHRITIQRYTSTLKKLKESDFKKICNYVLNGVSNYEEKTIYQ